MSLGISWASKKSKTIREYPPQVGELKSLLKKPDLCSINKDPFYLRYAPKNPPQAVIFIQPGCGHSAFSFENQAQALINKGFEVYALSSPGHIGESRIYSEKEFSALSLEDYASALNEKLEKVIAKSSNLPIYLLGHSMGGMISMLALTTAGQADSKFTFLKNISGLILLSSSAPADCRFRRMPAMIWQLTVHGLDLLRGKSWAFSPYAAKIIFFNNKIADEEFSWFFKTIQPESAKSTLQSVFSSFERIFPFRYNPNINLSGLPVLNLLAEHDNLISPKVSCEIDAYLKERGSKVKTEEIKGAPHDSMISHPEILAEIIDNWCCAV